MELEIGRIRIVCEKPLSATHRWFFVEFQRKALGFYSYRLVFSSAFTGWGIRVVNCGDGAVPFPTLK